MRVQARGTWHAYVTPELHAASIKAEAKSLHVRRIYVWEHNDLSLLVCDRIYGIYLAPPAWTIRNANDVQTYA